MNTVDVEDMKPNNAESTRDNPKRQINKQSEQPDKQPDQQSDQQSDQQPSNKEETKLSETLKRETRSRHSSSDSISAPRVRQQHVKKARYSESSDTASQINKEELEAVRREVLSRQSSFDEGSISAPRVHRATRVRRVSRRSLRSSASESSDSASRMSN